MTYVIWFLMLTPAKGTAVYVAQQPDAVACQIEVIKRRDSEPTQRYSCLAVKSAVPWKPAK